MQKSAFLFFVCFCGLAMGQQDPLLSSEGQRAFWFNPASIGTLNKYSVSAVGRTQWVGIDGAPQLAQFNSALKCIEFGNNPTKPNAIGSVGLNYTYDQVGSLNSHAVNLSLNLQFRIKETFLSVGLAPGVERLQIEYDLFPPTSEPDPVIENLIKTDFAFNLAGGIYWFNQWFSVGFSSTHLTAERFKNSGFKAYRHYYLTGFYKQPLGESIALRLVTVYRTDLSTSLWGAMLYGDFMNEKLSVGIGKRYKSAITASVATRWGKFYVGYFLDYETDFLSDTYLSHEIRLAYELFDNETFPLKR